MRFVLSLALVLLTPTMAFAHPGLDHVMGFSHGLTHPLGGLDHLLAMVAVGILAAAMGGHALWAVPLSFMAMMVVGFGVGIAGTGLPLVETGIALSSIGIGAAATLRRPLPQTAAMALVGVFALFHGHAHGAEMPASAAALEYAAGFLVATGLLHLAGIAATLGLTRLAGRHAAGITRLAGGLAALGGVGILAGWL